MWIVNSDDEADNDLSGNVVEDLWEEKQEVASSQVSDLPIYEHCWQSHRLKSMGTMWKTQQRISASVAKMTKDPIHSRTH